jgi:hypothetical protein
MSFVTFLRKLDLSLYNQFLVENLMESNSGIQEVRTARQIQATHTEDVFKELTKVSNLSDNHFCKKFVVKRKIPSKYYSGLYFCPKFKTYVNSLIPDKFESERHEAARMLIPLRTQQGNITGFHARALDPTDDLRYIAIMLNEDGQRVFGLENVDFNRRWYITEGAIDSMFLDNALGACGAELVLTIKRLNANMDNSILIYDNEPRNKEICKKIHKAIKNNARVVIWPNHIEQKDINDMILAGYTQSEIMHIIDTYNYRGLSAELALADWKRVDDEKTNPVFGNSIRL